MNFPVHGRLTDPTALFALAAFFVFGLSAPIYPVTTSAAEVSASQTRPDPRTPITVGPRELVGKPELAEKAAASALGGLVGSVLGGSSRDSSRPKTRRDPSRKQSYNNLAATEFDIETQARALWTDEGLLISARIEESPGKGTFQGVFLESCDSRRLYPQRYEIYDLWNESSISVSWSKTSTSNGRVVGQDSGSWSSEWSEDFASLNQAAGDQTPVPGAWRQLGFDRAQGGVRQIGAYFRLTPAELETMGEVGLFVHTTRPLQDPVVTAPAHWVLASGSGNQPLLSAPPASKTTTAWLEASAVCSEQRGLLVASAAAVPLAVTASGSDASPPARTGLPIPANLFVTAKGTGRTTGHIADLTFTNPDKAPVNIPPVAFYIPSDGKYQSYVARPLPPTTIAAGSSQTVPVDGYCGDVRKAPVPAGADLPPASEWIVATGPIGHISIPPRVGAAAGGRATIPGTDTQLPRAVSQQEEPLLAAALLLAATDQVERKTAELQAGGLLNTPYSGNPEREREAVVQQTIWIYAAELEGEPYTRAEFTERLEQQYEDRSGVPIAAAKPEDRERVQQGADDFWDAFELVGVEAKIISHPDPSAPTAGTTTENEAKAATLPGEESDANAAAADGCAGNKHVHHTDPQVQVQIADSYGDKESREKISAGIEQAVKSQDDAYVTSTPPSTAYSIWREDAIGGISSAYAKSVFLEENSQEWVWSTDPLKTSARGTGVHTLSYQPGPGCKAHVAGAALMWIKSSSEAFDPLERSIEVFRSLDAVKELSVKYVADKLPPGIDEAVEAGVDAITDPASDTYAGASGQATLTVGGRTDGGASANRVVYKRKDKEDKAIIGGGATVKKFFASDARPNSLTSRIEGKVDMEAGATGNGFAKAYLESVYGTLLVGICECPGSAPTYEILSDSQLFIRSDAAKGAVDVAKRDMQDAVQRISKDIESGAQGTGAEELKKRIEAELRRWGDQQAGQRFQPREGRTDD